MNVSVSERWGAFAESAVKSGRYGSASEVVRKGLRLVEEREARLTALRDRLNASIAQGGEHTRNDVLANLQAVGEELVRNGN